MDQKPDDQTTPDSWEQHSDGGLDNGDEDSLSKPFLGLNVDAPPFVPSFATLVAAQAQQTPIENSEPTEEEEKEKELAPGKLVFCS